MREARVGRDASEMKASLWQGSRGPSRMPSGCGMSL